MRGFFYSGIIFIFICVVLIGLAYVYLYYENLQEGLEVASKTARLYTISQDVARVLDYGINNVIQDAVSDTVAIAFTNLADIPCTYSFVSCEILNGSTLNSTNVGVVTLSDGHKVTCYKYFFLDNISLGGKITCIGSPGLSFEWYNITNNQTEAEDFFNNEFGVTCDSLDAEYFFKNDTVNRSQDIFNPRFYDLVVAGYKISSPGEYGGITGCGFGNITNSSDNNYGSPNNCEAYPFENGSTNFTTAFPVKLKDKVCKELTENNFILFKNTLKNYSTQAISEVVGSYPLGAFGVIDDVKVNGTSDCSKDDELRINLSISVKYTVTLGGISKSGEIKTKRDVFVKFISKEIGTTAKRVVSVWLYNNSTNSTYFGANCTVYCFENKSLIKYTNETVTYVEVYVYHTYRAGLPPDSAWVFEHPFHVLTWYNEHTGECGLCDEIIEYLDLGIYTCDDICSSPLFSGKIICDGPYDQGSNYTLNISVKNDVCVNIDEPCGEVAYGW